MANNRLYIVDKRGEKFLLAKSMGRGWQFYNPDNYYPEYETRLNELDEWLTEHDAEACYGNTGEMKPTQLTLITENEE